MHITRRVLLSSTAIVALMRVARAFTHGHIDVLAPAAPDLTLVSGTASPVIDINFTVPPQSTDVVYISDNGLEIIAHAITANEVSFSQINLSFPDLAAGTHNLRAAHAVNGHKSGYGPTLQVIV